MSTINNITALLKAQKKTQKELCDYLGITKNAFTDWKSGRIKSYTKHLPQIAEFFNVSVDYLLGKENQTKKLPASDEEFVEMLREHNKGKAQIFFCGADGKVVEVPPEAEAILKSVIDTFNPNNPK